MKKSLKLRVCGAVLVLSFLLALSACGTTPAESAETAAPVTAPSEMPTREDTLPEKTESATESALSGPEDLEEGMILFYRQEGLKEKRGELLSLADAEAAWYEGLFPRTHYYDPMFSKEGEQRLLRLLDYCLGNGYQGFSLPDGIVSTDDFDVWQRYALPLAANAPEGADDYDLLVWAANSLADRIVYGDRDTYYFTDGYQLYDAMVKGVTVCSGYSDAMYYLCNLLGVDCLCVEGNAISLSRDGGLDGHAWNLARIGEQYYVFDLTAYDSIVMQPLPVPIFFALSEKAMYSMGGNSRTNHYADEELIPACESCFDPVSAWNGTPEGAMRSFLTFYDLALASPEYMLTANDLAPDEWSRVEAEDGFFILPVSYEGFLARVREYMSKDCFESCFARFYRDIDGSLAVRYATSEDGVELYQLLHVIEQGDGSFSAELTRADGSTLTVPFSAEESEGRYRITEISLG